MNPPHISYRPAVASDARAMIDVHYAAVQAIDREHYPDEVLSAWSPPPDASRRDWLAELIRQTTTLTTVAVADEGGIVGFCVAIPAQGLLKALYVHPDFTGQGIGQALLQRTEAQCRDLGLESLELNASYNAAAFYRRSGYEALGPVDQRLTDTVVMGAIRMVHSIHE